MLLLKEDHIMILKKIENENTTYFRPNQKCKIHSAPCDECDFVNRFESQEQENLVMDICHNQKTKQIIPKNIKESRKLFRGMTPMSVFTLAIQTYVMQHQLLDPFLLG